MNARGTSNEISLRRGLLDDFEEYYRIKCQPSAVAWSGFAEAPDHERLRAWYSSKLEPESTRLIFMILVGAKIVGYCHVDVLGSGALEWTALGVSEQFQGRGIGAAAAVELVRILQSEFGRVTIHGWACQENGVSCRMIESAGYKPTGEQRTVLLNGGRTSACQIGFLFVPGG